MQRENRIALSKVRLDNAKILLSSAQGMIDLNDYKSAANRSYYAIFNAMRAELALLGVDHKKHKGVISEFRKQFIQTEIFPKDISKTIDKLFEVRTESDYNDFYMISKAEVEAQLYSARDFVAKVEEHLLEEYGKE